jgi:hypothetical protein
MKDKAPLKPPPDSPPMPRLTKGDANSPRENFRALAKGIINVSREEMSKEQQRFDKERANMRRLKKKS